MQAQYNRLRWQTALDSPTYAAIRSVQPDTLGQVQARLAPSVALLEYFPILNAYLVFVVTHNGCQWRRCAGDSKALQAVLERWPKRGGRPPGAADNEREVLAELYHILIQPVEDLIADYDELLIVPYGPLHHIPFPALLRKEAAGVPPKPLLARFAVSILPSAATLRYLPTWTPPPEKPALVGLLVPSVPYRPELPELRASREEMREVMCRFSGDQVRIACDEKATKELLFSDAAAVVSATKSSPFIHVSCHAEFNPYRPLFSGLLLYDGILTAEDLFTRRLSAHLVVASACETGLVEARAGDDLVGLTEALLYAGVGGAIVSLWQVSDRSTQLLMSHLYQRMLAGTHPAEALRHAQQALCQEPLRDLSGRPIKPGLNGRQSTYDAPFFWAPFIYIGPPRAWAHPTKA